MPAGPLVKHHVLCSSVVRGRTVVALAYVLLLQLAVICTTAVAQTDRSTLLEAKPIAEVEVQSLSAPKPDEYENPNPLMMYQPLEEDPLSFYVRTQDGEWQIPTTVEASDPWVRLVVLSPARPTIVDIAIDLNGSSFRAAREQWIDKLLNEAKATFLVRTGAEAAEAAGLDEAPDEVVEEEPAATDANDSTDATDSGQLVNADAEATEQVEAVAEDEPQVPMVTAQSRQASSLFKRLINYLAADQSTAEREEVRWLLAEWTGGPAQLTLSPAFAWRRADAAPLWHAIDLNGDNQLGSEEIAKTSSTLKEADIDRNEIISIQELERLARKHDVQRQTNAYPLVAVVDQQTNWHALIQHLAQAYPQSGDASAEASLLERIAAGDESLTPADLVNLVSLPPDLVYRVSFASKGAYVRLLGTGTDSSNDRPSAWRYHSATTQAITVEHNETYLEMTAAQGEIDAENASGDMQQTQVAIGAVVDGFPLLRLLDHDNNRQLTQREQKELPQLLTGLDRNQDGQVDRAESPTAIRLTVTHGPFAHQQLATATAAQRPHGVPIESAEVPSWFVGMDRNNDGDLSRREFQGSPTQFAAFDVDGDGLISRAEILANEAKK